MTEEVQYVPLSDAGRYVLVHTVLVPRVDLTHDQHHRAGTAEQEAMHALEVLRGACPLLRVVTQRVVQEDKCACAAVGRGDMRTYTAYGTP